MACDLLEDRCCSIRLVVHARQAIPPLLEATGFPFQLLLWAGAAGPVGVLPAAAAVSARPPPIPNFPKPRPVSEHGHLAASASEVSERRVVVVAIRIR